MLQLQFDTDNAAFYDQEGFFNPLEVGDILRRVALNAECGACEGTLNDSNGNLIGEWFLSVIDECN